MNKVCIVAPGILGPTTNGGIGAHCYYHAVTLAKQDNFDVTILLTSKEYRYDTAYWKKSFAKKNINYQTIDTNTQYIKEPLLNTSYKVFLFLKEHTFDEVHFQDWYANGFVAIQAKKSGLFFQNTYFTMSALSSGEWVREGMKIYRKDQNDFLRDFCERFSTANVDALITPTQHMQEWLTKQNWEMPPKVIKTPYICSEHNETQYSTIVDYNHFCFYGRLETRKGLEIFVEALKKLLENSNTTYKISFLGKNATVKNGIDAVDYIYENIQKYIDNHQITVSMHNDFSADEATQYLLDTGAIAVMPSIMDNLPYVILDCIQNNNAFITSNIGGIAEVVDPSTLFDLSAQALCDKMQNIHATDFKNLQHKYTNSIAEKNWINISKNAVIQQQNQSFISDNINIYKLDQHFTKMLDEHMPYKISELITTKNDYIALLDQNSSMQPDKEFLSSLSTKHNAYSFYNQTQEGEIIPSLGYIPILSEQENSFAYGMLVLKSSLLKRLTLTKSEILHPNVLNIIATKLSQQSIDIVSVPHPFAIDKYPERFIEEFEVTYPLLKNLRIDESMRFPIENLLIPKYIETREFKINLNKRLKKLFSILNSKKCYAVYGFNNYGKNIFKELLYKGFDIRFFIDQNAEKLSEDEKGPYSIFSPKQAPIETVDTFIIATDKHKESMMDVLKNLGVSSDKMECY